MRITEPVAAILLIVAFAAYPTEIECFEIAIPKEALEYAIGKVDGAFSCSRFDGYADCYWKNPAYRDSVCRYECFDKGRFSYRPWFGAMCYCCKCPPPGE